MSGRCGDARRGCAGNAPAGYTSGLPVAARILSPFLGVRLSPMIAAVATVGLF